MSISNQIYFLKQKSDQLRISRTLISITRLSIQRGFEFINFAKGNVYIPCLYTNAMNLLTPYSNDALFNSFLKLISTTFHYNP